MRLSRGVHPAAVATAVAAVVFALTPAVSATAAPGTTQWRALGHALSASVLGKKGDGRTSIVAPVDRTGRTLVAGKRYVPATATRTSSARTVTPHVLSSTPLSTWTVHYDAGFNANPQAEAAFQRAVDTWAHSVASSVPITVDAAFVTPTDPSELGAAGPLNAFSHNGVYFPSALANSMAGSDLDPQDSDIGAEFANNSNLFYYGADPAGIATASCTMPGDPGPTVGSCYDFESVVLHELGHGLGFLGSVGEDYSDPVNRTGDLGTASYGVSAGDPTPLVFDIFTETADGTATLDYPNHSAALHDAITSNGLYWLGGDGASADRGREPRLFAPSDYLDGSTYSHLSDASYPMGDPNSLMTPYADQGDTTRDPGEVMLGMFRDMGWTTPGLPGSLYTALAAPVRVLDTGATRVANGQSQTLSLAGQLGVPSNATAVVLNLTGVSPLGADDVRAFPTARAEGAPVPQVSNLNNGKGETRANLVTVALSTGGPSDGSRAGKVDLIVDGGATRLIADLQGYYAPTATTYFHPIAPVRILNTLNGTGSTAGRVVAGSPLDLKVTEANGVPADAAAVAMTVTAVSPTAATDVSVYPTGPGSPPSSSSLNLAKGRTVANQVVAGVGAGGQVSFKNAAGATHLIADLVGWYDTNSVGGTLFRPTLPTRLVDTRPGKVGPGGTTDVAVSDVGDTTDPVVGVPAAATAAVVNVTGVAPTVATDLSAFPKPASGTAFPNASNVNLSAGQTAASLATVRLGSGGTVRVRNAKGLVAVIVDISGWFGPA
ncbi:MAG: hypothetical protein JWM02_1736 [Frankiales bacterium]|nr:hypothetical protein [Frankiales bacterium]